MSESEPQRRLHPLEVPSPQQEELKQRDKDLREGRLVRVLFDEPYRPWLTWGLLGLLIVIFGVSFINARLYDSMLSAGGVFWPSVVRRDEWWRLFTHMFLHFDLRHIALNGLALYSFGQAYEKRAGHIRFLLLFLLSGVAGGVLSLLLSEHNTLGAGASGAIFGLGGAELVFLRRHQKYMGQAARSAWFQLLTLLGLQIMIGFTVEGIGNWAHIGGLIMGAAWTWIYGPLYTVAPQIPQKDEDGIGTVRATDTQPLSSGRLWGVIVLVGVLLAGCFVLKLGA